jgi:hypothetical protein
VGTWAAARAIALGDEPEPVAEAAPAPERPQPKSGWDLVTSRPGAVAEPDSNRKPEKPKLKVHRPEPEPKPKRMLDRDEVPSIGDVVFTEGLIAKMFANLAAHGMTLRDLAG